jgi:hypothetical protein
MMEKPLNAIEQRLAHLPLTTDVRQQSERGQITSRQQANVSRQEPRVAGHPRDYSVGERRGASRANWKRGDRRSRALRSQEYPHAAQILSQESGETFKSVEDASIPPRLCRSATLRALLPPGACPFQ